MSGTIYLLHFSKPFKHAKHYIGFTENLDGRFEAHQKGQGARLLQVLLQVGITWRLVRTWKGS